MLKLQCVSTVLAVTLLLFISNLAGACPKTDIEWHQFRDKLIQGLEQQGGFESIELAHHQLKTCRDEISKSTGLMRGKAVTCTQDLSTFLDFMTRKGQGLAGPFAPGYRDREEVKLATKIPEELLTPDFMDALLNAHFENPESIETLDLKVQNINSRVKKKFVITMVPNFAKQVSTDKTGRNRIAFLVVYSDRKLTQFIQATLKDDNNLSVIPNQLSIVAVMDGKSYFNDYRREGHQLVDRPGEFAPGDAKRSLFIEESCMLCHTSGPLPLSLGDKGSPPSWTAQKFLGERKYIENLELFNKFVRKSFTRKSAFLNEGMETTPLIGSRSSVDAMSEAELLACSGLSKPRLDKYGRKFVDHLKCARCHDGTSQSILGSSADKEFVEFRTSMPPGWTRARSLIENPDHPMSKDAAKTWRKEYHTAIKRCVHTAHLKQLRKEWTRSSCSD